MATTLYLLDTVADTHLGTNSFGASSAGVGWTSRALGIARGSGVVATDNVATVTTSTDSIEFTKSSVALEWISPPVAADATISGTVTVNGWASESNMSANVVLGCTIDVLRANALGSVNSNTRLNIAGVLVGVELAVLTRAVRNATVSPTSTVVNRGDRLRVTLWGYPAGTMAATYTFNASYNGTSAAADGDSYVTFTENLTFESAPGGSVLYLTDTASAVSTASVDREAWTSRGAGVQTDVRNTAAGWTAPLQLTDTAGGTVVDWFTRPLTAFTLAGMAVANIRAASSSASANDSIRCEIARVEGDGTSPTVWASWCIAPITTDNGELGTTEAARTANVSGDDLAITNGQRLRIRLYSDDMSAAAMAASFTTTVYYAGTSGGASGDTYITFPQTLTEHSSAPGPSQMYRFLRANRFLTSR